ncbi:unnamed protein product [Adineta steineri]|uniref:Uncharacterized protein n=1 Tax=Adineta steineri TaxID=433720 RepID=A0A813M5E0_9BILA|nr:unnamed protein product [Adineta steineri]
MPNIEELNLSIVEYYSLKTLNILQAPKTLDKLRIECGTIQCGGTSTELTFEIMQTLLKAFNSQLLSLILIMINPVEDFSNFDKVQSLVSNFTCLESFQYLINTIHQPNSQSHFPNVKLLSDSSYSLFTLPKPQQFDTISERFNLDSRLTFRSLYKYHTVRIGSKELSTRFELPSDLKLVNLRKIYFEQPMEDIEHDDIHQFVPKIIAQSPNLNSLSFTTETNAENLIEQLNKMIMIPVKKRIHFLHLKIDTQRNDSCYNSIFLFELSNIFPSLKALEIEGSHRVFGDYFVSFNESVDLSG